MQDLQETVCRLDRQNADLAAELSSCSSGSRAGASDGTQQRADNAEAAGAAAARARADVAVAEAKAAEAEADGLRAQLQLQQGVAQLAVAVALDRITPGKPRSF